MGAATKSDLLVNTSDPLVNITAVNWRILSLTMTFLWMGTIPVQAQLYGPPGDFGWRKSVPLHLILDSAVVADLGLNDEVAAKLMDLKRRVQKDFEEALAKARTSEHTIRMKYAAEIDSLLTKEQQIRLHQIHLQYGTFASGSSGAADVLSDSAVAKELELTEAQRREIRYIHEAITRAGAAEVKTGNGYKGSHDLENKRSAKIMNVLTSDQKEAFEKLKGRPFIIDQAKKRASP